MRVVCISDTHGLHDELQAAARIPPGDVLVHAGDFTDTGERDEVLAFNAFLATLPHKYKLVIAGNHESSFDRNFYPQHWHNYGHQQQYDPREVRALLTNALYLEDQAVLVDGFLFYGSPWQPEFCSWAFNLPRGDALVAKWQQIPDHVDVLVTHSPPLGRGDRVGHMRVGCRDLLREVQTRVQPTVHVFGHVHEGYGTSTDGVTTFVNASSCTHDYEAVNPPLVVELTTPRLHHDAAVNHSIQYEVLLHEQLRVCSQKPVFVPIAVSTEPPPAGPRHEPSGKKGLKEFSVEGTTSALLFESTLKLRPVKAQQTRALRYLFHRGFQNGATSAGPIPDTEDALLPQQFREDKLNGSEAEAPTEARREARRRASLSRRVTISVIEELSDSARDAVVEAIVPTAVATADNDAATQQLPPPRRARRDKTLHRREAVAKLATMVEEPDGEKETSLVVAHTATDAAVMETVEAKVEDAVAGSSPQPPPPQSQPQPKQEAPVSAEAATEDETKPAACIMCKFNYPGHVHSASVAAASSAASAAIPSAATGPASAETVASPPPTPAAECIMCKYQVVGHVHPGSQQLRAPANNGLLSGSAATVADNEERDQDDGQAAFATAARTKAVGSKRLSSWF